MDKRLKISRYAFLVCAWLFVAGILTQVFFVGLSLLGGQPSWRSHIGLGHGLGLVVLLIMALAYSGQLPGRMKRLSWLSFGTYILQAEILTALRSALPLAAALHPVFALLLFGLAAYLAVQAWRLLAGATNSSFARQAASESTGD